MKFSIVTPSYNQGTYIRETIESVLSQEGDFSIEYLIYDACSKDDTVAILEEYDHRLAKDEYPIKCAGVTFSWVSEKDRGESDAVNKGFRHATGDILSFTSSDDYYEPGSFKRATQAFQEDPSLDLVYGDMNILTEATGKKVLYVSRQMDLAELTTSLTRIPKPSAFFTRRIIDKVGGLDENLHYVLDYDLWIRILMHGKGKYLSAALSTFRVQAASKTQQGPNKFNREIDRVHKKYGLTKLNTRRIQGITRRPAVAYLRKTFPTFYALAKRAYYRSMKAPVPEPRLDSYDV